MPVNVLIVDILFILLVAIAGTLRWPGRRPGEAERGGATED